MAKKKKRINIIILISSLCSIVVISVAAFFIYFSINYKPNEYAKSCMVSDSYVTYKEENDKLYYAPKIESHKSIIFYGGAKVQYKAYAPLGYNLAKRGVNVIICSSPFNFALFNIDEAENVIGYKPNQDYYIMGHSLGGTAASMYVEKNYNKVKGIIFLASYSNSNLSNLSISSLTITASNDLVCKEQTVNNNKYKLPPTSYFYEIEGGNHAQFGAYGEQKGDGKASINNQTQVEQTTDIVSTYVNNS